MMIDKFFWMIFFQLLLTKETYFQNIPFLTTEEVTTLQTFPTFTVVDVAPIEEDSESSATTEEDVQSSTTQFPVLIRKIIEEVNSTEAEKQIVEILKKGGDEIVIGEEEINTTVITICSNKTYGCFEKTLNEKIKENYNVTAKVLESSEEIPPFRLQKSTAIGCVVFLVVAIMGYLGCVGYRRHLQRKYGDSQMLTTEEVYKTTDLRYFEI